MFYGKNYQSCGPGMERRLLDTVVAGSNQWRSSRSLVLARVLVRNQEAVIESG